MTFKRSLRITPNGNIQIVDQTTGDVVWEGLPDDLDKYNQSVTVSSPTEKIYEPSDR